MSSSTVPGAVREGFFGSFGGRFVPKPLEAPLEEVTKAFEKIRGNAAFEAELKALRKNYCGRPTPLYLAKALTEHCGGAQIYLKREDLCHTGSHKINNTMGQILLARAMGKRRVIAETGAGQHGVATATACAMFRIPCVIYMGAEDARRQALNVFRMRLLGAEVREVHAGSCTLKDAVDAALVDYAQTADSTFYLLGSAVGPHPYPTIVRYFQSVIGREAREQILEQHGSLPQMVIACIGGGSNSIGMFSGFIPDKDVKLTGVEAGGRGTASGDHAARFLAGGGGRPGVLHGARSYVLFDADGETARTHSISAGLDYPSIGPEHAMMHESGRAQYVSATDQEALNAFQELSRLEGIIPALESSHAVAHAMKVAREFGPDEAIIVNLSGRGDKDVVTVSEQVEI